MALREAQIEYNSCPDIPVMNCAELQNAVEQLRPSADDAMFQSVKRSSTRRIAGLQLFASLCFHSLIVVAAVLAPVAQFAAMVEMPAIEVEVSAAPDPDGGAQQVSFEVKPQPVTPLDSIELTAPVILPTPEAPVSIPPIAEAQTEDQKEAEITLPSKILNADKSLNVSKPSNAAKPLRAKREVPVFEPKVVRRKPERTQQSTARNPSPELQAEAKTSRRSLARALPSEQTELGQGTGISRSSYSALVSAQINARKFYPATAREQGLSGSVGVAFTIGRSGRVGHVTITRSSGNGMLDGAARQALQQIAVPPPPEGSFSGSTVMRYSLTR